jgi:hypothetical protein
MDKDCKDIFYLYLHSQVGNLAFEKGCKDGTLSIAETYSRMFQWRIPNNMKPIILKIWLNLGIVKRLDRRTIQFIKTGFNKNNLGDVYDKLGLFPEE